VFILYSEIMMYKIALIFFLSALLACQRKTIPVITERKDETSPKPVLVSEAIVSDTATGRQIFMARCGRCHGLPDPLQYTTKRWETILASMIPRSRINKEQALHLTAFVNTNADK